MKKYKYQTEYELSPCFWGTTPAKYVRLLVDHIGKNLSNMNILDFGAGEGKNAVYLASYGANLTAVDISSIALSRFSLQPNYDEASSRIKTKVSDIRDVNFGNDTFDIVIAYGILHCLDRVSEISNQIAKIKNWVKKSGYFVGCTFTDELPSPECQPYLSEQSYLKKGELRMFFDDWSVIEYEDSILEDLHPTTKLIHRHSLSRILARKP
jgi:2-polyprenyl-3-methyl-5-hydroxy-6-metoxy-1,4-benzoquinol methylase